MRFGLLSLPFIAAVGCWGGGENPYELVRDRAAEELRCGQVDVRYYGPAPAFVCVSDDDRCTRSTAASYYTASGCGTARLYRCDTTRSRYGSSTTCKPASDPQGM